MEIAHDQMAIYYLQKVTPTSKHAPIMYYSPMFWSHIRVIYSIVSIVATLMTGSPKSGMTLADHACQNVLMSEAENLMVHIGIDEMHGVTAKSSTNTSHPSSN